MQPIYPPTPALQPARVVNSAWLEHGPFAFWIVEALRPRLIVELGTHNGYSFGCFCEQMQRSNIPGRAIAVDTWRGDEHAGAYSETVYTKLAAYVAANYASFAELKRMYFSEALASVPDGTVDLLHADGRHFYDDVVEDFTSWIPKLSDRAVVLFHDTQVRERDFGVYRFWAELEAKYPTFEFHHGHGLGVLGYGSNIPAAVAQLLALPKTSDAAAATRRAFAEAGAAIARNRKRPPLWERTMGKLQKLVGRV